MFTLQTTIFLITMILLTAAGYLYLAQKIFRYKELSPSKKKSAKAGIIALVLLPFLLFPLRYSESDASWSVFPIWFFYVLLGGSCFLILLFLTQDAIAWVHSKTSKAPSEKAISRREFLSRSLKNVTILGGVSMTAGGIHAARKRPPITQVTVKMERLPKEFDGYRIMQISDLHVGLTIREDFVKRVCEQAASAEFDLLALTGDLVDGSVPSLGHLFKPILDLKPTDGIFVVTGNHEYYSGALEWVEFWRSAGAYILLNESRPLRRGNSRIHIGGVTDYRADHYIEEHASSPAKAFQSVSKDEAKILLAHQPRSVFEASKADVDLQLSGHTHGGQFFPWNLFVGLVQPYVSGLHRHENTQIYVNRGTGYWGPPIRLGVPSEITVLTLRSS